MRRPDKIVKLGPAQLNLVPRAVLNLFCWIVLKVDAAKAGPYAPFRELLPSMRYDFAIVSELGEAVQSFNAVESKCSYSVERAALRI